MTHWEEVRDKYAAKPIRLGLDRVSRVLGRLDLTYKDQVVFTVAGTNGKGSTCAMLQAVLLHAGYQVGRYTSPHLVSFAERIQVNGLDAQPHELDCVFEAVASVDLFGELSLFELETLACISHFAARPLDVWILEVGLGGRLDAVNVIDTDCAIITSIDIDHTEYLGSTREAIGFEKAGIMRAGKPVIVCDPMPPGSVIEHGERVGADLWRFGRDFNYSGDKQQWQWAGRAKRFNGLAYPALRGANQLLNAAGALAALEAMRDRVPITAQAVRNGLALVELPGRFQIVAGQPTLVLDVAHNPHAVATLAQNLDQMGFFSRTHAVFGAMRDKDIALILTRMAPLVDHWHFTDLPAPRAASADELAARHAQLGLKGPGPVSVARHADPLQALAAALSGADPADRIVVFGSFLTVGGVLKNGVPRLTGKHAL